MGELERVGAALADRKSTRLNSSHSQISYAVFCVTKTTGDPERAAHHRPGARRSAVWHRPVLYLHHPAPAEIYTLSLHDALPICFIYAKGFALWSADVVRRPR